jgi:hypothetical protein
MEKNTVKDIESNSTKLQMITNIFVIMFCIMSLFTMSLSVISYFSKTDETKTVETVPATVKSATTDKKDEATKTDKKDETAKTDNKKDESSKPVKE